MSKNLSKILFVFVFFASCFLFAKSASAATVYVSNSATKGYAVGNDSNTYAQAQNKSTPWLTVTKAVSSAVSNNDTIVINDGTYSETSYLYINTRTGLTITNDPVTGQPYGVVVQVQSPQGRIIHEVQGGQGLTIGPIVLDAQNSTSVNITTDSTNPVTSLTLNGTKLLNPTTNFISAGHLTNFSWNNVIAQAASLSSSAITMISTVSGGTWNMTGGTLTVSQFTGLNGTQMLYMHPGGGYSTNLVVSGVTMSFANTNNKDIYALYGQGLASYLIHDNVINITGGTAPTAMLFNNYIATQGVATSFCHIYNNTGTISSTAGSQIFVGDDSNVAIPNPNSISDIQVYNNNFTGANHGIAFGWVTGWKAWNNTISNATIGLLGKYTTNGIASYNVINGGPLSGGALRAKGGSGDKYLNNTIIVNQDGSNCEQSDNTSSGIIFKNNICSASSNTIGKFAIVETGSAATFDNNDYYTGNPLPVSAWSYGVDTYATMVNWQSAGHDINSIINNPLFVSSSNFSLQASSPAINAGADVGLTSDYIGTAVPQGSAPDIGAYEYLLPSAAPTIGTPSALSTTSLRWTFTDNANNETGFKVYDNTNTLASSSAVTDLSYLDETGLSANTQYTGRYVTAYNAAGDSAHSATASSIYTKIQSPTDASWDSIGVNSITLSASGTLSNLTAGTSGLYFANTTASTNSGWTQTNSWQSSSLSENTQYTFQITSRNGDSLANTAVDVGSKYTLADTPTNLSASLNSNNITLSVDSFPNDTSGQSGYYFSRSGANSGWIQTNSWTDTGLSCGHEYTYSVKYRNGDGTDTSEISTTKSTSGCGGGGSPAIWTLPTVPIGGFKVSVNGGALMTSNRNVILNFNAGTDIKKMAISMTGDFTDASQEDYTASKQWDLCSKFGGAIKNATCPDGTYKVYAQFYTAYGRSSNNAVASSIIVLKSSATTTENLQQIQSNSLKPFTKQLKPNQTDLDVKKLQIFLNSDPDTKIANSGPGSPGKETNLFGTLTKKAVIKFQEKYAKDILTPWGLKKGTGVVGKTTLQKINELISK